MATRTIRPQRDDSLLSDFESMPERAPSTMSRGPGPGVQFLLFIGFFFVLVGGLALAAPHFEWRYFVTPGWGYGVLTIGVTLLLIHCYVDPEQQFRRIYASACFALLLAAVATHLFNRGEGTYFLPLGLPLLTVAFLFLLGVTRNETDFAWQRLLRSTLLAVGILSVAGGLIFGHRSVAFLTTAGIPLLILGLAYLGGFISVSDPRAGDARYRTAIGVGAVGLANLLVVVVRSWTNAEFLIPSGLILGAVSLLYLGVSVILCSDWPVVVLMRRELLSYFLSPIAYLVLFGLAIIFWFHFCMFVGGLQDELTQRGVLEPIVARYVFNFFPVVAVMFIVPLLTMRLFSEEQRTGSLEVLLTAPIGEWAVVMGKFLAALIFFLISWISFFLMPVGLRIFGGEEFDWRPLLSFFIALTATGSGFLAMGLFFSSLTANQIVAAVLTFAGMLLHLGTHWLRFTYRGGPAADFFTYVSFVDLWSESGVGYLPIRFFAFHASLAVFFLYLTHQVLTARKWK